MKMKAQTAMEYLMTYGWAILIVIIVGAALYALGIFNPAAYSQSAAIGFQNFQIPQGGWQLTSGGTLTLQIKNMAGSNIDITQVQATYAGSTGTNNTVSGSFAPGGSKTITMPAASWSPALTTPLSGSYSIPVTITFDNLDTGMAGFKSAGTLTGTIS